LKELSLQTSCHQSHLATLAHSATQFEFAMPYVKQNQNINEVAIVPSEQRHLRGRLLVQLVRLVHGCKNESTLADAASPTSVAVDGRQDVPYLAAHVSHGKKNIELHSQHVKYSLCKCNCDCMMHFMSLNVPFHPWIIIYMRALD
jgi:hypothetical protein